MIQSPLALAALVTGLTGLAFWLDRNVPVLSRAGAGMIAVLLGALLSNVGLVPADSVVYDAVSGPVTSLAITWLLLAVNLADLRKAGGRVLGAFALACFATCVGALLGSLVLARTFGAETWRLSATLTATYTGGGINFVAVGRGVGLPDQLFAGATAADNVTTALWLAATLMIPLWFSRFFPAPPANLISGSREDAPGTEEHPFFAAAPMSTLDIALLVATAFLLLVLAQWTAARVPAIPMVLWLTTFALLAGHLTPLGRVPGALQLGNLALVYFFITIGIHSRIADIVAVGVGVFWFTLMVVAIHGVITFGIGRLLRLDVASLAIASQAAVGGPSSALAVAVSREWPGLVLPAVITGLLGYASGNYLGFAMGWLTRHLGIGIA